MATTGYVNSRDEIKPFSLTCSMHVIHGIGNSSSDFATELKNPANRVAISRVYDRLMLIYYPEHCSSTIQPLTIGRIVSARSGGWDA